MWGIRILSPRTASALIQGRKQELAGGKQKRPGSTLHIFWGQRSDGNCFILCTVGTFPSLVSSDIGGLGWGQRIAFLTTPRWCWCCGFKDQFDKFCPRIMNLWLWKVNGIALGILNSNSNFPPYFLDRSSRNHPLTPTKDSSILNFPIEWDLTIREDQYGKDGFHHSLYVFLYLLLLPPP